MLKILIVGILIGTQATNYADQLAKTKATGENLLEKTNSVMDTFKHYERNIDSLYIQINVWSNELIVKRDNKIIKKYRISSGTENRPTPIGKFKVAHKSKSWGGGFGTRWLGLNVPWGSLELHGTNKPALIGNSVSSGCIRMNNKDVEELYEIIREGTVA